MDGIVETMKVLNKLGLQTYGKKVQETAHVQI